MSTRLSSSTTKSIVDAMVKDTRVESVKIEPSHEDGLTRLRVIPVIKDRRGTHRITSVMYHALKGTGVKNEAIEGPRPIRKKVVTRRGHNELRFSHYDRDYWIVSLKDESQRMTPQAFDPFQPSHTKARAWRQ